jgi:hypothetical protein
LKGLPTEAPLWLMILEAAGWDPLRAQEMEANLSERWWMNYLAYREGASRAAGNEDWGPEWE